MRRSELVALFVVGLLFYSLLACFQHAPGYMDADYYFSGGLRLVQGHGFTETTLWNYLDNPQSLPHPSHGYWFPLASILSAAGMFLTGQQTFFAARLGFILVAALVSPVTALLSYQIISRREIAIAAGVLAIFCGYHAPFMPTTDNFGLFMLSGGLFFLLIFRRDRYAPLLLGLVAGFMNLSRSDGIIWFVIGLSSILIVWFERKPRLSFSSCFRVGVLFVVGYALVMGPWVVRNLFVWGTPLTPAGSSVLWMTRYDETFAWPPARINLQNWLAAGWQLALSNRIDALKLNFLNTIGAQAGFLLFPFILIGAWALRKDLRVRLALLGWVTLFLVMSIVFPFAGSRGSFFHAGAALQPIWFTSAVIGVDVLANKARKHGLFTSAAPRIFRTGLVMAMILLTVALVYISIIKNDWNKFDRNYVRVEKILLEYKAQPSDVVIVANAPGYYAATGRSAIIVPDENLDTVHALAHQFGARFLVLEKAFYTDPMIPVYNNPENQPGLTYLGEFDDVRIFTIQP